MSQMPLFQSISLSVSDINRYLRQLLESDEILQDVWVNGEVSNFSRPASGHIYFTLKDSSAALKCVMWRTQAQRLLTPLRDGMSIEVHGSISMYESGGTLQLYADAIRQAGEGALYKEFLRLKARLEAEGLFDPERKRPIPAFPHRIGIVTSGTGAALQDMLNCLRRRFPLAEVVLASCPVQGDGAPPLIVKAIRRINQLAHPDVILLARGGGSLEDLWAFNDERVAYAIIASQAPVITGIGHEVDFTIADFAADLRAPTPTAAAELATPNRADLRIDLGEAARLLSRAFEACVDEKRWQLNDLYNQLHGSSPINQVRNSRQSVDHLSTRLDRALQHDLQLKHARLDGLHTRLQSLNPEAVLRRGYAILSHKADGRLLTSTKQALPGEGLRVRMSDGSFDVTVDQEQP